jgi:hypothetical protein
MLLLKGNMAVQFLVKSKYCMRQYSSITIIILDIIHRSLFCLKQTFRRLDSGSVFGWFVLIYTRSIYV